MTPSLPRLFLVVDDPVLRQVLTDHFLAGGYGLAECESTAVAAVVDDAAAGAASACRRLREECRLPVVALAAPSNAKVGLVADAVVAKPLRLSALMAKLEEVCRRCRAARGQAIGRWRFDAAARLLVDGDGRRVRLTDKEATILAVLSRAGGVVGRDRLLAEVWGYSAAVTTHTLETHVYRLRRKIEADPARATLLVTEPGGYRLAG